MKILLAPAETKKEGGIAPKYSKNNFAFREIFDIKDKVVQEYVEFIDKSSIEELSLWFGLKNLKECEKYKTSILDKPTMKAIQRYTGVAFEALGYDTLELSQQKYCDENILLFSNLFGVLKGSDLIPDYKFKQGATLDKLDVVKYYKTNLKDFLDSYLEGDILDLRAGFYDKVYKISKPYVTMKFLKNGKVVSHWAKHYRGEIVRVLAQKNIQSIAELMDTSLPNLSIVEIQKSKNKTEIIYQIDEF